ncbi:pyrroline-5-carboxylate reductase family protein [Marinobacter bohaiensis]|uniref:pyrroline-5-carboxylate reductase family protein n=1 Tax=Marinobacter bohaiensis TaxID=2201898 RepID=UPI000DAE1BFC|nr:NAD(P)-binding domain-containing protein [Marinobacter bohaiensis]
MTEALGILGVGHLASYVVAGLRKAGDNRTIRLSPRNRETSEALRQTHGCEIAPDNQAVADECRVILLAVRPQHLDALLDTLTLRDDHLLISCVAGVSLDAIRQRVGPARVVRTLPLACAEVGEGVVPLFPDEATARELLSPLGRLIAFDAERAFELASTAACVNGWTYAFLDRLSDWFAGQGLSPEQARELVVHSMRGATGLAAGFPERSLRGISDSIATPGTYTRDGLDALEARDAFGAWEDACQLIKDSLDG